MNLELYRGVVKKVFQRHQNHTPDEFFEALKTSLEVAADLIDDVSFRNTLASPIVSIESARSVMRSNTTASVIRQPEPARGAVILSAAPPVAGAGDEPSAEFIDYYESAPGKGDGAMRLQNKLQTLMPQSIRIRVPNVDDELTLNCGISSPGDKFCHVSYSIPGQPVGPRVTIMTSQKEINSELLLKDITEQAAMMYSQQKRTIQPAALPPNPPPSNQELQQMLDRERKAQGERPASYDAEDVDQAREWSKNRSVRWQ